MKEGPRLEGIKRCSVQRELGKVFEPFDDLDFTVGITDYPTSSYITISSKHNEVLISSFLEWGVLDWEGVERDKRLVVLDLYTSPEYITETLDAMERLAVEGGAKEIWVVHLSYPEVMEQCGYELLPYVYWQNAYRKELPDPPVSE